MKRLIILFLLCTAILYSIDLEDAQKYDIKLDRYYKGEGFIIYYNQIFYREGWSKGDSVLKAPKGLSCVYLEIWFKNNTGEPLILNEGSFSIQTREVVNNELIWGKEIFQDMRYKEFFQGTDYGPLVMSGRIVNPGDAITGLFITEMKPKVKVKINFRYKDILISNIIDL